MGSLLLLILAVFMISTPMLFLLWLSRRRSHPFQFGLRGLFAAVTLVALILGGIGWWRMANLAQVRWLVPTSPEATALFPLSEVVQNDDGDWSTVYYSQRRKIHDLTSILEGEGVKIRGSHSTRWHANEAWGEFAGENREAIEEYLVALRNADKLGQREMVLRGRVEDSDGKPVAGATVDLMGEYVYINHFRTRDDGTFVMPITPTEGWWYYLRIRPEVGEWQKTGRFSLSYDEPERVVIVRLP